ncbi:uncharacterized protein [Phaseolus vulgaris]|uniref:uncharacterized protein n=1 Tax=Phaseolus vulgaris TaxID=3885 RepID=UPI0035C9CD80
MVRIPNEAFGHHINNCLALGYQLDELVKNGFLKDYLMEKQAGRPPGGSEGQQHEAPVLGEIHTIAGGFSGGECTASQRKRYARSVMSVEVFEDHSPDVDITFTKEDLRDVVPHDNDPIVISLVTAGRTVHRVLVYQGSSADVMFWPTFERLQLSTDQLRPYGGCLYGFAGDQVEVRGYIELRTTFTDGIASRMEKIKYLVVNAPSAYNILLGRPTLNRIGAVPSTRHMKVKLPSMEGVIVTIRSDQEEAKRCYENSLKNRRSVCHVTTTPPLDTKDTQEGRRTVDAATGGTAEGDAGMDLTLEVAIDGDVTMGDVELEPENNAGVEEEESSPEATRESSIVRALLTSERRPRPVGDWLEREIGGKVFKLVKNLDDGTQEQIAKKSNGKWRMCVDFTDLNKACPKDSYPLPSIDALVDSAAGCKLLSFLDAFSGYNQIKMHPMDEEKTAFMTEKSCYCYKVMPFGLKNAGATYQRLMDKVLAPMLGRNVQAYVDDMVVTSLEKNQHIADLEELFVTIAKYKLKLNPEKCIFGVEA